MAVLDDALVSVELLPVPVARCAVVANIFLGHQLVANQAAAGWIPMFLGNHDAAWLWRVGVRISGDRLGAHLLVPVVVLQVQAATAHNGERRLVVLEWQEGAVLGRTVLKAATLKKD